MNETKLLIFSVIVFFLFDCFFSVCICLYCLWYDKHYIGWFYAVCCKMLIWIWESSIYKSFQKLSFHFFPSVCWILSVWKDTDKEKGVNLHSVFGISYSSLNTCKITDSYNAMMFPKKQKFCISTWDRVLCFFRGNLITLSRSLTEKVLIMKPNGRYVLGATKQRKCVQKRWTDKTVPDKRVLNCKVVQDKIVRRKQTKQSRSKRSLDR